MFKINYKSVSTTYNHGWNWSTSTCKNKACNCSWGWCTYSIAIHNHHPNLKLADLFQSWTAHSKWLTDCSLNIHEVDGYVAMHGQTIPSSCMYCAETTYYMVTVPNGDLGFIPSWISYIILNRKLKITQTKCKIWASFIPPVWNAEELCSYNSQRRPYLASVLSNSMHFPHCVFQLNVRFDGGLELAKCDERACSN